MQLLGEDSDLWHWCLVVHLVSQRICYFSHNAKVFYEQIS